MSEAADDTPIPAHILKAARSMSNLMALWPLCEHHVCRKLGRCRAVPFTCWDECIDFPPYAVIDFVLTLFSGNDDGLSFDDALARIPDEVGEEW